MTNHGTDQFLKTDTSIIHRPPNLSSNTPPDPPDRMIVGVVGLEGVVDVLGLVVVMVWGLWRVCFIFLLDMI